MRENVSACETFIISVLNFSHTPTFVTVSSVLMFFEMVQVKRNKEIDFYKLAKQLLQISNIFGSSLTVKERWEKICHQTE